MNASHMASMLQDTVRTAFRGCTVMTVAHRLHTILDSDRVLVLDAGRVKEYDAPGRLLQVCPATMHAKICRSEERHMACSWHAHRICTDLLIPMQLIASWKSAVVLE